MASWVDGDVVCYLAARGTWVYLLAYHRWTRFCLCGRRYDCWLFRDLELESGGKTVAKFLDQVKAAQKAAKGESQLQDPDFEGVFPAIFEFCSITRHNDGAARQTATLLFFVEAGTWKVCLGDRESGLSLWAAGETQMEALEALEACLQSPNPQWRQGTKRTPKKP